jgi:hypothetical protein
VEGSLGKKIPGTSQTKLPESIGELEMTSELFVMSRGMKEMALLQGVGRFCESGCGKQIKGKKITLVLHGKLLTYFRNPKPDQRFCSIQCSHKYHNHNGKQESKSSLLARIQIKPEHDSRMVTIYLGQKHSRVMITKNDKAIWRLMNQLQKEMEKTND